MQRRPLAGIDLALLALLMGAATSVAFYRFGVDNQISELPIVLRAVDPGFLPGDFYTDAASARGPRSAFAWLVAALATRESLPGVSFALTLLCNAAIAGATALLARELFRGSTLAGAVAAALVMSLATFRAGYAPTVYASQLLASRLATAPLLFALWAGLTGRPLRAVALAAPAALLHPTLGLEGGALALALAAGMGRGEAGAGKAGRQVWAAALLLWVAVAAAVAAVSLPRGEIDPATFVAIESGLRHPHHGYPGALAGLAELRPTRGSPGSGALLFYLGAVGAWLLWLRLERPARRLALGVGLLAVVLPLLCVAAAIAIDHIPTRAGALARPLRLLLLLRWVGLGLVGGLLAVRLERWMRGEAPGREVLTAALTAGAFLALAARPQPRALLCLGLYAGAVGLLATRRRVAPARAAVATLAGALPLLWLAVPEDAARRWLGPRSLAELRGPEVEVARWAAAHTPASAVFVTPPELGLFRLLAERALVVDFRAFPFQERAMSEWRRRFFACYGEPAARGWSALSELSARYRASGPGDACGYGARYALLHRDTPTRDAVLFENRAYKIVARDPQAYSGSAR